MTEGPLNAWMERNGEVLRLQLNRPKANIIDAEMIDALGSALERYAAEPRMLAAVLDAAGPHFSFGASVQEHLPDQCAAMLAKLHALIMQMIEFPVPIIAAVHGQCLGGGLEVACAASRFVATPDASLGQPEISLAVFAPAASCLLPERVGQVEAETLLLSGKSIDAETARRIGLIDAISEEPADAALAWIDDNLIGKSASSLRLAVRAARHDYALRMREKLATVTSMYLDELMQTPDALEGLQAFLEKRKPAWANDRKGAD